ncbi:MAG: hypothetical protein IPP25_12905 [Saprospiraceae bacterium]|nr:hypothetical protein [Candidatus Opimibacter skivensis]
MYALTITDENCNFGIDSVEITILNSYLILLDIGPPQLSICEGEEYTVSLILPRRIHLAGGLACVTPNTPSPTQDLLGDTRWMAVQLSPIRSSLT